MTCLLTYWLAAAAIEVILSFSTILFSPAFKSAFIFINVFSDSGPGSVFIARVSVTTIFYSSGSFVNDIVFVLFISNEGLLISLT